MGATRSFGDDLERLVDSHIELCGLFYGRVSGHRAAPVLVTMSGGKTVAECLADLVDLALVAYMDAGFAQDPTIFVEDTTIFAIKSALAEAIVERT
jgi:hypothetical protein